MQCDSCGKYFDEDSVPHFRLRIGYCTYHTCRKEDCLVECLVEHSDIDEITPDGNASEVIWADIDEDLKRGLR